MSKEESKPTNFIHEIIEADLAANKHGGRVATRFPPEPNGYLHIGHAKSICLNFGIAKKYDGVCHLRFDDTNPAKESTEYVDSIKRDIEWLGFDWGEHLYFASDYFDQLYAWAVELIKAGKAYVCSLSADEMRAYRGNLKEPGKNSPYRDRTVEENLELFEKMRDGEFDEGAHLLRAKIDMASPNLSLRDPALYRIRKVHHHRTGDKWCIYPMYDWAHGQSDAIEEITHSICTLEFANHRPLYEWFLDAIGIEKQPRQYEFARLNLNFTVMSKRKLLRLVEEGHVTGWDDPRMPTISGMRRRGYTPLSLRNFAERVGVAKRDSVVDIAMLEHAVREDLNRISNRVMTVLDPLKVTIENYPDDLVEEVDAVNNPEDESAGKRKMPFSKVVYIERADFKEEAPRKYFRLAPGKEVRLRYGYYVTCTDYIKDEETGEIKEVICTYDPESKGGNTPDGRRVRGTLHWVSAAHAKEVEVRLYDRLFNVDNPNKTEEGQDFTAHLNPNSLEVKTGYAEPHVATLEPGTSIQFERIGYFCVDPDSTDEKMVINRTVPLRDSWAKIAKK
jgi:glutaminyl-tRNA synthetase